MQKLNLLVAAGGTGGHLFPAMSVVEELSDKLGDNFRVVFVGNSYRIEGRKVPEAGYPFFNIPMIGFRGKFSPTNLIIPLKAFSSISICHSLIKRFDINAVLCAGAYLSYPAGIAATMTRKPLILMESNVYPGKSIKALASKSSLIITAFEETIEYLGRARNSKIVNLGNPVRKSLLNLPNKETSREMMGLNPNIKTLLVFGGSLGARTINESVEKLIKSGKAEDFQIIWQTGNDYNTDIQESGKVKIFPFIDDMSAAYAASDLVLSRSGATTMAELSVVARPSILIPYPHAANNHQEYNAAIFEKHGAGYMIKDNQLWDKIEFVIPELLSSESKMLQMAAAAKSLSKPKAGSDAAEYILKQIDN